MPFAGKNANLISSVEVGMHSGKNLFLTKTRTLYIFIYLCLLRGMKYAPGSTVFCKPAGWTVLFLLLF